MKRLVFLVAAILLLAALAIPAALADANLPGTIILPETVSGLSETGYSFTKEENACTITLDDENEIYADYSGDSITGVSYSWVDSFKQSVLGVYTKGDAGAWKLALYARVQYGDGDAVTSMGVYTADGTLIFDAMYVDIFNVYVKIASKANVTEDAVYCLPLAGDAYDEIPPVILAGQWSENQWYRIDLDHTMWTCSWTKVDSAPAHDVPGKLGHDSALNLTGESEEAETERIVTTKEELRAALESPSVSSIVIKPELGALIDLDWNATVKNELHIIPNQGFTSLRITAGGSLTLASGASLSTIQQGDGTGQIWLDGGKLDASAGVIDEGSIIYWQSGELIPPASLENVFLVGGAHDEAALKRFANDRRIGLLLIQSDITMNEDLSFNVPLDLCDGATLTVCATMTINEDWELLVEKGCTLVVGKGGSIVGKYNLEEGATFIAEPEPVVDPDLIPGLDPAYAGRYDLNGVPVMVKDGKIDRDAVGLTRDAAHPDDWYFCSEGVIRTDVTQIVPYETEWFYVKEGRLDTTMAAIVEYDGGLFAVAAGRLVREYNGLIQNPNGTEWYFVAGGQVQAQHTGLAMYDDHWFYIINGRLAEDFVGDVEYDGATFHVDHGMMVG